jgi:hypothetical protein
MGKRQRKPVLRGVMRADRNLGEFDITGDVKFTKIRLDTCDKHRVF